MTNGPTFRGALERTHSLSRQLEQEIATLADAADAVTADARRSGAHDAIAQLNSAVQRLRQSENEAEWTRTLTESAGAYCRKALWIDARTDPAPAVRSAVEAGETTVCAVTESELGESAALLGNYVRAWLIPIGKRGQATVGVLCAAADDEPNLAALELLGALTPPPVSTRVEQPQEPLSESQSGLVQIAGAAPGPQVRRNQASKWEDLPGEEQAVHLRAQQFARVFAADLVLRAAGRTPAYATLKKDIDAGRDTFRREFIAPCPTMVDYLHLELVRTLGRGDPAGLGSGYPGPLR